MKKGRSFVFLSVIMLIALAANVYAQEENLLERVLKPFENINIATTYEVYWVFIDFVLYLLLFMGLTRIAFSKFTEKSGGGLVSNVIAIIFAIGMAVAGKEFDFRIGHFGSYIVLAFLAIIAYGLYSLLHYAGLYGNKLATGFVILIVYGVITGVSPAFYNWLKESSTAGGVIDGVLALALVIGIILVFWGVFGLWPGGGIKAAGSTTAGTIHDVKEAAGKVKKEIVGERTVEKDERRMIKSVLKISDEAREDSKQMVNHLKQLRDIVAKHGATHPDDIQSEISKIAAPRDRLFKALAEVKQVVQNLKSIERSLINQVNNLKKPNTTSGTTEAYRDSVMKKVNKKFIVEMNKFASEQKIQEFEDKAVQYEKEFESYLVQAVSVLRAGRTGDAVALIDKAISVEKASGKMLDELHDKLKNLKSLTNFEIRFDRTMKQHIVKAV